MFTLSCNSIKKRRLHRQLLLIFQEKVLTVAISKRNSKVCKKGKKHFKKSCRGEGMTNSTSMLQISFFLFVSIAFSHAGRIDPPLYSRDVQFLPVSMTTGTILMVQTKQKQKLVHEKKPVQTNYSRWTTKQFKNVFFSSGKYRSEHGGVQRVELVAARERVILGIDPSVEDVLLGVLHLREAINRLIGYVVVPCRFFKKFLYIYSDSTLVCSQMRSRRVRVSTVSWNGFKTYFLKSLF